MKADLTQKPESPLSEIPTPIEIQKRIVANSKENRILRSLFNVAKKVHAKSSQEDNADGTDQV